MNNKKETIGYWWLGENFKKQNGRKTLLKFWWGICKKTRKVSSLGTNNYKPLLIQNTHIINGKECFDGDYCFNVDCPYAKSNNLIDAFKKTRYKGFEDYTDEELLKYLNGEIEYIESEYLKTTDENKLKEIFEDGYRSCSITENAYEVILFNGVD